MEFLGRARADLSPLDKPGGREIPIRPDLGVAGQVMEEVSVAVGQAPVLGRVQVFGPQAAAMWALK